MIEQPKKTNVMEQALNIGKIEDTVKEKAFTLAGISRTEGYHLKKIYVGENSDTWVKHAFPGTEVVNDVKAILHDDKIDLVIMPTRQKEELQLIAEVLRTGKNIRMV